MDGPGTYTYVRGSPVQLSDPSGTSYELTVTRKTITVRAEIVVLRTKGAKEASLREGAKKVQAAGTNFWAKQNFTHTDTAGHTRKVKFSFKVRVETHKEAARRTKAGELTVFERARGVTLGGLGRGPGRTCRIR